MQGNDIRFFCISHGYLRQTARLKIVFRESSANFQDMKLLYLFSFQLSIPSVYFCYFFVEGSGKSLYNSRFCYYFHFPPALYQPLPCSLLPWLASKKRRLPILCQISGRRHPQALGQYTHGCSALHPAPQHKYPHLGAPASLPPHLLALQ